MINSTRLQKCFIEWMRDCCELTKGEVIAIDGKTLRGTYDKGRHQSSIIGQVKTSEKSNEITAIPELLKLQDIHGCLVTIDAMGCQRDIAKTIVDKGADYLLAVKGNQKRLEKRL